MPVARLTLTAASAIHAVENAATVTRIEIDPEGFFPDLDRSNQTWSP